MQININNINLEVLDLNNKKVSGIYIIINCINNKFYIGSSKNIKSRIAGHLSGLRRDIHSNIHLQRAWNIDSESNFNIYILELVENHELLIEREQYWMDKLNACQNGYNMLPFAANRQGYTPSQETINKFIASRKGYKHSEETKAKMKDYHVNNKPNLGRKATEETRQKQSEAKRNQSPETIQKQIDANSISVVQLTRRGELVKIWSGQRAVEKELGYFSSHISACCSGTIKTYKNFIWVKYDDYINGNYDISNNKKSKFVNQYDLDGNLIKSWDSVIKASQELSIPDTNIYRCCNGKQETCHDYIWKFAE